MSNQYIFLVQIIVCINFAHSLKLCNETVTKLQICRFGEYDKGLPINGKVDKPWDDILESVTIFSVSELDENQNTISLDILLATWWQDRRITLKSTNPQEYETRVYNRLKHSCT